MKALVASLVMMFSVSFNAHAKVKTVELNAATTANLLKMFKRLGTTFYGGIYQGSESYSAQVECSNKSGSNDLASMTCAARALAGFSRDASRPLKLRGASAALVRHILADNDMSNLIASGELGLGAKIRCSDNSRAGDGGMPIADSCNLTAPY